MKVTCSDFLKNKFLIATFCDRMFLSARAMNAKLDTQQAVMKTEMNELTREVREHNNFARRMPVVEEQIKVINHRIKDLEDNEGR